MNLHEYQAKELFSQYKIPIPNGYKCTKYSEIEKAVVKLNPGPWVVKCQIHAGGRGKSGGVQTLNSIDEIHKFAKKWIGKRLVTYQTDNIGQTVNSILIERKTYIKKELYLSLVLNRIQSNISILASFTGGINIENDIKTNKKIIFKENFDVCCGFQLFKARNLAFQLKLFGKQINQFVTICENLTYLFIEKDLTLAEINPIAINQNDDLLCLDGKLNIDENALYRQVHLKKIHDNSQLDSREVYAEKWGLNYIPLQGNIGCMVNGAGLAMGTMDLIKLHGGNPANFLDVGGDATVEKVDQAFRIIILDSHVKSILINIFGGIVKCDLIADGIIQAISNLQVNIPVIVRLEGNNSKLGAKKLINSNLNIITANSLDDAVKKAIENIGRKTYVDSNR
ncbi:succinyl-CoA synthetase, beta subunit [Wigglesworthia glossinidia endosymbiont of Glossina morsitans morsitans (Yale colony)]|uniref:Succinate--CoA ligase [ADP-forming] subunit beta n=1 Tax=Wigglesworthia glossinidia endosymbiont of Glossina morsitans morsitans (Yale colony) TaxID=1142511 RepID=H6Q5Y4_WIGGL|nr:ADP-forming succinate--CoA ligase subunit beta [Wigglesworthia glossinidia]AFA41180.1 succinyl-CoA synthetase, beta subunit [Wigglesworthia glossinidia endosymbiont of Glossina morsitans morsitans (Yale colony)]